MSTKTDNQPTAPAEACDCGRSSRLPGSAASDAAISEIASIAGRLSLCGHDVDGQKILDAVEVLALRIEHLAERKKWWQTTATDLAKERGELFRAGEAMQKHLEPRRVGYSTAAREDAAAWDAAAQPIRDMIASLTPASLPNHGGEGPERVKPAEVPLWRLVL